MRGPGMPGPRIFISTMKQRLQKILAQAGLCSRRECERLIEAGRVQVDREVVTKLGTQADPDANEIRVDGDLIRPQKLRHYLLNKPQGYICTNADEYGRARAIDLVPDAQERLYTVGRLDADSEGLIIVTNDGELANLLTHPRHGVSKTYRVEVAGQVTDEELEHLRKGIWSSAGRLSAERVKIVGHTKTRTVLQLVLAEGRNRAIRRMLVRLGHKVKRLRRVKIGPVADSALKPGAYRNLTQPELQALRQDAEQTQAAGKPTGRRRPGAKKGPRSTKPQT